MDNKNILLDKKSYEDLLIYFTRYVDRKSYELMADIEEHE